MFQTQIYMSRYLLQAVCIGIMLVNFISISSAQVNSLAYQQRQSDLIDSALINNFTDDAIVFQAYRGIPVDTNVLNNWIDQVPTRSTLDFLIVKMVRILYLSNGEYDNKIYSALDTLPFWMNKGDTLYGYWSENHMIQWMSSDWLLHEKFNKPIDPALYDRLEHYLDLKLQYGFYEFFSTTYAPYSFGGIINLADFAQDPIIKSKATAVAQKLISELLMVTTEEGTFFPAAGRNYYGSYDKAYGHNVQSIIYLTTGLGRQLTRAQHGSSFLATSDLYIEDAAATYTTQLDTLYSIGHSLDSGFVLNSTQTPIDKIVFQWSSGAYFMPEVAKASANIVIDSMLWNHVDFEPFVQLKGLSADQIEDISEVLSPVSKSTLICGQDVHIFKNNSVSLASIQNFHPGKAGFQQFPCVANIGQNAIMTASGETAVPWRGRKSNHSNEHMPYVEQNSNVALLMYWPENGNIILESMDVSLLVEDNDMDEIVEDSLWIMFRQDNNYVAYRRSCADLDNDGAYTCPTDPVQSWAVVVGDSTMYNSFANFQTLISNAEFEESFTHNAIDQKTEYYASVTFDNITIDHTWKRDSVLVGIDDVAINEADVTLFPNPAQNSFTVILDAKLGDVEIQVMDITGRNTYNTSAVNTTAVQIDMNNWTDGMYLVRIQHSNGSITKKLLKN